MKKYTLLLALALVTAVSPMVVAANCGGCGTKKEAKKSCSASDKECKKEACTKEECKEGCKCKKDAEAKKSCGSENSKKSE